MNINEQFENDVELLMNQKEIPDLETRIKQVEDLTEWYYAQTGKHYNKSYYLDMLGNYLMLDDLRNRNSYKVQHEEYPVLSYTQERLRNRKESRVGDENLDYVKLKVVDNHANAFRKTTTNKEEI